MRVNLPLGVQSASSVIEIGMATRIEARELIGSQLREEQLVTQIDLGHGGREAR